MMKRVAIHDPACRPGHLAQRGFTLLEAVLVIVLTGVVAAMVGVFIRAPIDSYVDQARRAELTDTADTALRRMARELPAALPNSVRVAAGGKALEFIPVVDAGRYRAAPAADGSGDFLDVDSASDGSFEVIGPGVDVASGDQLVVYNLGLPGADAYSGESRRALTSTGSALSSLTYAVGGTQFPYASPSHRFQVVGTPVSYLCTDGAAGSGHLRRYSGYAIQAAQPTSAAAAPLAALSGRHNALLAGQVESCSFDYEGTGSARNALLTLTLKLSAAGESVTLLHQMHVDNSP